MSVNESQEQQRCAAIFERLCRIAGSTPLEVSIEGGRSSLTRFANNTITQNVSEEGLEVSVRVQLDGRTARATTNRTDDESLRRVFREAERLARVQEQDPSLLPLLTASEAGEAAAPARWDEATAAMTPAERAEEVERMVAIARREGLNSAGTYATGGSFEALFNSAGVARWHRESHAEASVTMQADDSSGWQKQNAVARNGFDSGVLAATAAEKAKRSARPIEVDPGRYTVILEPSAVVDLVGFLAADFSGQALLEQRSCFNGRLGKRLFGENITLYDDVCHRLQSGAAFDGEGVARQGLTLIERGEVRELAMARSTAAQIADSEFASALGRPAPTGHGFSLPNEGGESPANLVFRVPEEEAVSVDEMIARTERGLLVTRLWYIREVDAYEKILTGMTRDGTFLVEKGKVGPGIRNLRFNQGVIEMLGRVLDLGQPVRASGEEAFDMVAPAMRVEGFHFTEITRF